MGSRELGLETGFCYLFHDLFDVNLLSIVVNDQGSTEEGVILPP